MFKYCSEKTNHREIIWTEWDHLLIKKKQYPQSSHSTAKLSLSSNHDYTFTHWNIGKEQGKHPANMKTVETIYLIFNLISLVHIRSVGLFWIQRQQHISKKLGQWQQTSLKVVVMILKTCLEYIAGKWVCWFCNTWKEDCWNDPLMTDNNRERLEVPHSDKAWEGFFFSFFFF